MMMFFCIECGETFVLLPKEKPCCPECKSKNIERVE